MKKELDFSGYKKIIMTAEWLLPIATAIALPLGIAMMIIALK